MSKSLLENKAPDHLLPIPGTQWHVWRPVLLRSAGFPVTGLDGLSARGLAEVADRWLAGEADLPEVDTEFAAATSVLGKAVHAIAADPLFRTAVAWQNPNVAATVESAAKAGPDAPRTSRHRRREDIIAKYYQRYCAKNDTVGFFGPMCWTSIDPTRRMMRGAPGRRLVRDRQVHLEWWALNALAQRFAADPEVRPWLPVALRPDISIRSGKLLTTRRSPQPLSAPVAELLTACDGTRSVTEVAQRLAAAGRFRTPADVVAQIEELVARDVLRIGLDLPVDLSAEGALRTGLAVVADTSARQRCLAALDRLCAPRDRAAAAETPDSLAAALGELDAAFTDLTGREPRHNPGETYAGRTLCHVETTRDLDLTLGGDLLGKLAALDPLLRSASWLTGTLATAYHDALAELHRDLAADLESAEVPLHQLWYLAQGTVFGARRPADTVTAEFLRRWSGLLGLADMPQGTREIRFDRHELAARVDAAFPRQRPGWWYARMHSPDLHICAPDWAAAARGDYTLVLGELHLGLAPFNTDFFRFGHPDPDRLHDALRTDFAGGRVELLLHEDWPRNCARNARWMHGPEDAQLGFAPALGPVRERLVPITDLTVVEADHGLLASAPDGRSWPLVEVFADLLGIHTFDTWKLAGGRGHTPRVVIDDLVLLRETWRSTVAATGLATAKGERDRYLAVRRWRRELDLPERVFVRVDGEVKPIYVDLTSPLYTRQLCTLLRSTSQRVGDQVEVSVTEMLPTPEQAWLVDSDGSRYTSELRLQIRDPLVPPHATAGIPR